MSGAIGPVHFDPAFIQALYLLLIPAAGGLVVWGVKKVASGVVDGLTAQQVEFKKRIDAQDATLESLNRGHAAIRDSLTEIRTVLVGIDGQNGLNQTVKNIDERLRNVEVRQRLSTS